MGTGSWWRAKEDVKDWGPGGSPEWTSGVEGDFRSGSGAAVSATAEALEGRPLASGSFV